jgi:hypothetical protein
MKYNDILNTFKTNIDSTFELMSEGTTNNLIETIKLECAPFLKHKIPMFRGMADSNGQQGLNTVRTDRKPLHSDALINEFMNEYLKSIGLPSRSEVLFGITNESPANSYGSLYYIFPRGNFKFSWNTVIDDMYVLDLNGLIRDKIASTFIHNTLSSKLSPMEKIKTILKLIKSHPETKNEKALVDAYESLLKGKKIFNTTTFPSSESYNEVMITCKDYYFINAISMNVMMLKNLGMQMQ